MPSNDKNFYFQNHYLIAYEKITNKEQNFTYNDLLVIHIDL